MNIIKVIKIQDDTTLEIQWRDIKGNFTAQKITSPKKKEQK